jgi:uncharacterized protein (TIGR02466 family)
LRAGAAPFHAVTMALKTLFVTQLYEKALAAGAELEALNAELEAACLMLAQEDRAGRAWCRQNGYAGYTSYASLDDLPRRAPAFADLEKRLNVHVARFAQALSLDLGPRGRLRLDSLWVNVLKPGAAHSGHIHPHSVVSGTYYVVTPPGSGALRLEDPRLPLMMAAPNRRADAPESARTFVSIAPTAGTVLLWESWLRHEVLAGRHRGPRISVSFNWAWR